VFHRVPARAFTDHYCDHFRYRSRDSRLPDENGWDEFLQGEERRINALPDLPDWLLDGTVFSSGKTDKDAFLTPLPKMTESLEEELDFLLYEIRNSVTTKCWSPTPHPFLLPIVMTLPFLSTSRILGNQAGEEEGIHLAL